MECGKRVMPRTRKYVQRTDGEGFEVPSGELYRIECCDCGLVHDFVFISHDGRSIGIATRRNNRATAQRRRYMKSNAPAELSYVGFKPIIYLRDKENKNVDAYWR